MNIRLRMGTKPKWKQLKIINLTMRKDGKV